jgi:hypothetical protein
MRTRSMLSRRALGLVLLAALAPAAVLAHHSFAVFFDSEKSVSVTGVVVQFKFVNPHGVLVMNVKNKEGRDEEWKFETNSPSVLRRRGWTPESLMAGETITVDGWPARDNPHYGRLRSAKRANGQAVGKPLGSED